MYQLDKFYTVLGELILLKWKERKGDLKLTYPLSERTLDYNNSNKLTLTSLSLETHKTEV